MCEPITIATAALVTETAFNVAGQVAGHAAGKKQAAANTDAANRAAQAQLSAQSARSSEEKAAAAQEIDQGNRETVSASAMARLSALSAGVQGNSVDEVLGQIKGDQGRFNSSVKQNLDMNLLQIQRGNLGIEAQRQARINAVPSPNPWITGLSIGSTIARGATQYAAGKPG